MAKSEAAPLRIKGVARSSKKYRARLKINRAAGQASATYGHQIHGTGKQAKTQLRRRMASVAASGSRSRRWTTARQLRAGEGDQARMSPREQLAARFKTWQRCPQHRQRTQKSRATIHSRLRALDPQQRSRWIRGPISGIEHLLLERSRSPVGPEGWMRIYPDGMQKRRVFPSAGD